MGAGKSTVGSLLAAELGWQFVDSDDEIVLTHGSTVADLFAMQGEAGFRELEREIVIRQLTRKLIVLALGGGALELPSTRESLFTSRSTHIIFLDIPLALAVERCEQQADGALRPVLSDRAGLAERFARRASYYRQAHASIETAGRTPEQIVRVLLGATPLSNLVPRAPAS